MTRALEMAKSVVSPPGDTIQETLDEMGMSQAELAERMGRPKEKVNDMIKGREPISTPTAFQLEKVLGIPAGFWLNREKEYRKSLYEIDQREWLAECKDWLYKFPVREMKKLGWLPDTREVYTLVNSLLGFFGVASPLEWERIYIANEISVSFRISLANTQSPHAISAWLRMGELQAKKIEVGEYDKKKFKKSLQEAKELAYRHPDNFVQVLQEICKKAGVALVYTPNLPKAPASGATRWFHNTPLIQLSGRYKTNDHFWFTFFHEAGHILVHGKKDIFLEDVKGVHIDLEKESEADQFASKWLLSDSEFQMMLDAVPLSEKDIIAFANHFKIPPGVIVGRLQHHGIIKYTDWNFLRQKVDLSDLH